ncbi:MAG: hypothetical protein J7J22_06050 [Candidatus Verstraetearchaeota archaeon]|nr:hypothetical protein [Candidatus Verstraetearchaeota archaeon]
MRRSLFVTLTSIFAALAIMFTILKLEFPFPVLLYLKFDFAEIPVVSAFFLINPYAGFITSIIHFLFLLYRSGDLLGASMKFSAVFSMLVGFWLIHKFFGRTGGRSWFILSSLLGGFLRIIVMSLLNVIVLLWIAPGYLDYAVFVLSSFFGYSLSYSEALIWTLIFTGVYNFIHVFFSFIPSIIIVRALGSRFGFHGHSSSID